MGKKEYFSVGQLPGLMLGLRRGGRRPLQRQIAEGIQRLIDSGQLPSGTALPATRSLARTLGVNRTTVVRAYQWLWSLGYIESRPGSYTRVRRRAELASASRAAKDQGSFAWNLASLRRRLGMEGPPPSASAAAVRRERMVDFTPHFYPPDDELPLNEFRKILNRIIVDRGRWLLANPDPLGYLPLRQFLVERLARYSIQAEPDEVMITSGLVDALELMTKTILGPEVQAIVEMPTAAEIVSLLKIHGRRTLFVPLAPKGMDLEKLRSLGPARGGGVVITMPNFQIPTGIVTNQAHREQLLQICQERRWPILESGFEEETACFGRAVLPIKSMDRNQQVIHLGAFSRVLIFGHQLGWIAGPKALIATLSEVRSQTAAPISPLVQAAVWELARSGRYDVHVKHMLVAFRRRLKTALKILRTDLLSELSWVEPDGGYSVWVRVRKPLQDPAALFLRHGVRVSPGRLFLPGHGAKQYFRLAVCSLGEREIVEGLERIKKALIEDTG